MAIQKRKAVAKSAQEAIAGTRSKAAKKALEEEAAPEEEPEEQEGAEMEEDPEEEISEEDRVAQKEGEIAAARTKELKALAASELKNLVIGKGLEAGNKQQNVAAVLAYEAKARSDQRAHEARLRMVVVKKKEELEALPYTDLVERCRLVGILGRLSKEDRVQQLLAKWQEDDGITKGLAAMAMQERHAELAAMDTQGLAGLCTAAGVDPLLKEVMVDRLIKHEVEEGRFTRPEIHEDEEKDGSTKESKADVVDAVLASESSRKKQKELQRQQQEAEANRRKDLQSKSVDDLRKLLTGKGQEATGKKNEMVEALMVITTQEEALAARRAKLRALGVDELRRLLAERKVEGGASQKKDAMISALFEHEQKARKELEAHQARATEVEAKKKEELEAFSATQLKEMCTTNGLKPGASKDDRVAALIEAARANGDIDKLVAAAKRDARKEELLAMEKSSLKALCDPVGIDVLVKDVVIERILLHESEHGRAATSSEDGKPPAKKARSSKK